jgi:hypothetical protein
MLNFNVIKKLLPACLVLTLSADIFAADSVYAPPSNIILGELVMYEKAGAYTTSSGGASTQLTGVTPLVNPVTGDYTCPLNESAILIMGYHDPAYDLYEPVLVDTNMYSLNDAGSWDGVSGTAATLSHYECQLSAYGQSWYWWAAPP